MYRLFSLTLVPGKIVEKIYQETLLMYIENKVNDHLDNMASLRTKLVSSYSRLLRQSLEKGSEDVSMLRKQKSCSPTEI